MITEDYVSFEIAKLLKEKGFDEQLCHFYTEKGLPIIYKTEKGVVWANNSKSEHAIVQPTLQMAMKWLREIHNIHIVVNPYTDKEGQCWSFIIDKYAYGCWHELAIYITDYWNSYEEACEAAIKYCLKNLI